MNNILSSTCPSCLAIGETCCAAAKGRQETATTLAQIVTRQSEAIRILRRERDEVRQVAEHLREVIADLRKAAI